VDDGFYSKGANVRISNSGMPPDGSAFTALKKYGLLLLNDPALPNLCRLVAGERVRGSWWAHPRAQEIFQVYDALENHADVLILKLLSGKVTYIHRTLWPQIVAVGRAREPWQMNDLSAAARKLLAAVDKAPVEPGREKAAAASELDARMLVFSAQFHSESGAHVRRLESLGSLVQPDSFVSRLRDTGLGAQGARRADRQSQSRIRGPGPVAMARQAGIAAMPRYPLPVNFFARRHDS